MGQVFISNRHSGRRSDAATGKISNKLSKKPFLGAKQGLPISLLCARVLWMRANHLYVPGKNRATC